MIKAYFSVHFPQKIENWKQKPVVLKNSLLEVDRLSDLKLIIWKWNSHGKDLS